MQRGKTIINREEIQHNLLTRLSTCIQITNILTKSLLQNI